MVIKILGSIIVIFSTTIFTMSFYYKDKFRKEDFTFLERILRLVKHEIICFGLPLEEVFKSVSNDCNYRENEISSSKNIHKNTVEKVFSMMSEKLEKREENSAENIWCMCWEYYENDCYFSKVDIDEIMAFGKVINNITSKNQGDNLEYIFNYINEQKDIIDKRLDKNGRFYYSLGILSGMLCVVMFI